MLGIYNILAKNFPRVCDPKMQERFAFPKTISYGNWPYSIWPFLQSPASSDHTHPSGISPTTS